MKKLFAITAVILSLFTAQATLAHENHVNTLSDEQAIKAGADKLNLLVSSGNKVEGEMLNESWKSMPLKGGQVFQKGPGYYIISFSRSGTEKTLYLLLDGKGELYNANFNGTFSELE